MVLLHHEIWSRKGERHESKDNIQYSSIHFVTLEFYAFKFVRLVVQNFFSFFLLLLLIVYFLYSAESANSIQCSNVIVLMRMECHTRTV